MIARRLPPSLVAGLVGAMCVVGCASHANNTTISKGAILTPPASPADAKSLEPLASVGPNLTLPAPRPVPADYQPPVQALVLYARGRDALADNQRFTAIQSLEQAVALDPNSAEAYRLLARAYVGNASFNDHAIDALQAAFELRPDNVQTLLELGRELLARGEGDVDAAITLLRMATLTTGYARQGPEAVRVDDLLAQALQRGGYDRAALDAYARVVDRLRSDTYDLRGDPEVASLRAHPEPLLVQIGTLYEKHGQWAQALAAYQPAAARDPSDEALQARVVRMQLYSGQQEAAIATAASLVTRFRANTESMSLLREACGGNADREVQRLQALHRDRPADRSILLALCDVLSNSGREDEARGLLHEALAGPDVDADLTRRLADSYVARGDALAAGRLLVATLASHPDAASELEPVWTDLFRLDRAHRLQIADVLTLAVPSDQQPARLYWLSRAAMLAGRDVLARHALQQAIDVSSLPAPPRPFAAAFRALAASTWRAAGLDEAAKQSTTDRLAGRARAAGDAALANEVEGIALQAVHRSADAASAFSRALGAGGRAPDLQLEFALASDDANAPQPAEQALWKAVSDHPAFEDGYDALFQHYLARQDVAAALRVLELWQSGNPQSVRAKLLWAGIDEREGDDRAAERVLVELVTRDADDADALNALAGFYLRTNRLDALATRLGDRLAKHPDDVTAAGVLADAYADAGRAADASRVLDAARHAVGNDAQLLYVLANQYTRIHQPETTEQVLEQVVRIDPRQASACNDLGYTWADAGKNLDAAEHLVRTAVRQEPDNASFLDSLGWVLYKRGQFADARGWLQRAIDPAMLPDPVVLDHLGDAAYRAGDAPAARQAWIRSLDRLNEEQASEGRDDLGDLKLHLQQKLQQVDGKQPASVAPLAPGVTTPATMAAGM